MNRHFKKVRDNVAPELWQRFLGAKADVDAAEERLGKVLDEIEVATRPSGRPEWVSLPGDDLHDWMQALADRIRRGPPVQGDRA